MARGIKTGGRKKGTPNRTTKEIRDLLSNYIYNEMGDLNDYGKEVISLKDRAEIVVKILPYIVPKMVNKPDEESEDEGEIGLFKL